MIVVLDGPAGSGKSSTARGVARALGFLHLDTGATYRSVTLAALRAGLDLDDGAALGRLASDLLIELGDGVVRLDGEDVRKAIRTPAVSAAVSRVARHPEVRRHMVSLQRRLAEGRDLVGEGRDLATVVFPDADLKIFLTASPLERARRRARELGDSSERAIAALAEAMRKRDELDSTREASPLMQAADAVRLDTSELGLDEVIAEVVRRVKERSEA